MLARSGATRTSPDALTTICAGAWREGSNWASAAEAVRPIAIREGMSFIRESGLLVTQSYYLATRLWRSTSITRFCKSEALMHGTDAACDSVDGRTRLSFCRAAVESDRS